ncbi:MAG: hypothetical protein ABI890_10210 [Lapillicoccus sp.]
MTRRQALVVMVLVVIGAVFLVLRSPVGGPPAGDPTIAAGGPCWGFAPTGPERGDRALLERALASWVSRVADERAAARRAQAATQPEPLAAVCAVNADVVGDETYVTMVTAGRFATYVEAVGTRSGLIGTTGDLADPSPRFIVPALPVGAGRWQLAQNARSAAVHLGSPGQPESVTAIPDGQTVVPVQELATTYGAAHPGALVHLLLLLQSGEQLFAAVGGGPYAASLDTVFPVALTGGALGRTAYDTLLATPSGVPLLSQAIGFTPVGRQEPQRISRMLTVVGGAETPTVGPVLVVEQQAEGDPAQPHAVSIVQLSGTGADVQPIGQVPSGGGWSGGVWLAAIAEGDHDPRTFVAVGRPARPADAPLSLRVTSGGRTVTRAGPVVVLTGAQLPGLAGGDQPPSVGVTGVDASGLAVPPLTVGP